jgi:hypothetical protein
MPDAKYRIILEDKLDAGADRAAVAAELCRLFRLDAQRAALFGRGDIQLAAGIDYWNAQEFETALKKTGAHYRVEEETQQENAAEADAAPLDACLNCGWKPLDSSPVRRGGICPRCGIVLGKTAEEAGPGHIASGSPYRGPYLSDEEQAALKKIRLKGFLRKAAPAAAALLLALAFIRFGTGGAKEKPADPTQPLKAISGPMPFTPENFEKEISRSAHFSPMPPYDYAWYEKTLAATCKNNNWPLDKAIQDAMAEALRADGKNIKTGTLTFLVESACWRDSLAADKLISPQTGERLRQFIGVAGTLGNNTPLPFGATSWLQIQTERLRCSNPDITTVAGNLRNEDIAHSRSDDEMAYLLRAYSMEKMYYNARKRYTADLIALFSEYANQQSDRDRAVELVKSQALQAWSDGKTFYLGMDQMPGRTIVLDQNGYKEYDCGFPYNEEHLNK